MPGAEAGSPGTSTSHTTTAIVIAFVRAGFEHVTREASLLMPFNQCSTLASQESPTTVHLLLLALLLVLLLALLLALLLKGSRLRQWPACERC